MNYLHSHFTFVLDLARSIIEISILSAGIYYMWKLFRGTRGARVLAGFGLILATMGFDYITTTNLQVTQGQSISGTDILASALTTKVTTAGLESSNAMLWLFVGTFLLMVGLAVVSIAPLYAAH